MIGAFRFGHSICCGASVTIAIAQRRAGIPTACRMWVGLKAFKPSLCHAAIGAWLVLITALGIASGFDGDIPFDQRTGLRVADARLVMSFWVSAIEPVCALFHIVAGAPNYMVAAISTLAWLYAAGLAWAFVRSRRQVDVSLLVRLWVIVRFAGGSVLLALLYSLFMLVIPLPGWTLVLQDKAAIVADLHSHTTASHDGFVSEQQNIAIHRRAGYGVVAWTEHYPGPWRDTVAAAQRNRGSTPEVIPGVEISTWIDGRDYYLILLRVSPDVPLDMWIDQLSDSRSLRDFIRKVHDTGRGAVVAFNRTLDGDDIEQLAAAGVDAFEIANFGHPHITQATRDAMVKVQRLHKVGLVAVSDWHGWSGAFRTWTVVKPSGSGAGSGASSGDEVVEALRRREPERITPIVSQMFEPPSLLRGIFSPFVEAVRYGGELSPVRLAAWWVWALAVVWIAGRIRRAGFSPTRVALVAVLLMLGLGVVFRGLDIALMEWHGVPHQFPLRLGLAAVACGLCGLLAAWWQARTMTRSVRR
jgi:hypothetical protein